MGRQREEKERGEVRGAMKRGKKCEQGEEDRSREGWQMKDRRKKSEIKEERE